MGRAEALWLHYFNQTLYEKGYITQGEHGRLMLMIEARGRQRRQTGQKPGRAARL